jgi:hypothetical protein
LPPYNRKVWFHVLDSEDLEKDLHLVEKFHNFAPENWEADDNSNGAITLTAGNKFAIVLRKNHLFVPEIAHEIFHAVCAIMRYVGMTLTEESEEAYAYANDYILEECIKKLTRLKLDIKILAK